MKKNTTLKSAVTILAVLSVMISFTSCKKEDDKSLHVALTHPTMSIEDAKKQPASGENTLLWNTVGHVPILAPDGHQITLGEFNKVSGYAKVKCINEGTHVAIHLKGLIPNGVYTIWVVTFKSPGYEVTLSNVVGVGALGPADGSKNAFTASPDGIASISATLPAGKLSAFGSVGNCLSSEYQVQLWGAYHIDGLTHGPVPGDDATWVEQFVFTFFGSQLN